MNIFGARTTARPGKAVMPSLHSKDVFLWGYEMTVYSEKLKGPRWQKKRLEILERDHWTCKYCGDTKSTLHVHHILYIPKIDIWDIPDGFLITLCESCHELEKENIGVSDFIFCIGLFLNQLHRLNIPVSKLQDCASFLSNLKNKEDIKCVLEI